MPKVSVALILIAIISFVLGVWPVGLAALGAMLYITKIQQPQKPPKQKTVEELEKENEALRAELTNQAVRHAMDKAEKRG